MFYSNNNAVGAVYCGRRMKSTDAFGDGDTRSRSVQMAALFYRPSARAFVKWLRRRRLVQAKFVFMQTVTVRPSCVGRLRRVHCLCDMCRYYCLLRAGKKSLINKTLVEMTTRKKSRSNLELSKRTKERRCTARKPNLWIGEHENQFLLCVLFSFVFTFHWI